MKARVFSNIQEVAEYCQNKYAGEDYIFRGQRQYWPLKSSLFRIVDEKEREKKWKETTDFCQWMLNNPRLLSFHGSEDALAAIAQHYGFATDLIDFTRDVKVAAYFATLCHINPSEKGVIYVATISDFEFICKAYKIPATFYIPQLPHTNGVWRLENQKGLFMHDYQGFVSQHPYEAIEDVLLFRQEKGKTITNYFPKINTRLILPPPNDLEREIELYESIRRRRRPITEYIPKNVKIIYLDRDQIGVNFEVNSPHLDWDTDIDKWSMIDQTPFEHFPKFDPNLGTIEVQFSKDHAVISSVFTEHAQIVILLREKASYRTGFIPAIRVVIGEDMQSTLSKFSAKRLLEYIQPKMDELLSITLLSPFSNDQVAIAMQNLFALGYQHIIQGHGDEVTTEKAFQDKISILLEYGDQSGVVAQSYAPASYFDSILSMSIVRERFNQQYPQYFLDRNFQLFQLVTDIRKLMSFQETVNLWASILIPSQLLFRTRIARIINPYHVLRIGYA